MRRKQILISWLHIAFMQPKVFVGTYIVKVFQIVDKVLFGVDQLVDDFLTLLLVRRYGIRDFLWHRSNPESLILLFLGRRSTQRPLEATIRRQVQARLLHKLDVKA